jgi:hypothetical protein
VNRYQQRISGRRRPPPPTPRDQASRYVKVTRLITSRTYHLNALNNKDTTIIVTTLVEHRNQMHQNQFANVDLLLLSRLIMGKMAMPSRTSMSLRNPLREGLTHASQHYPLLERPQNCDQRKARSYPALSQSLKEIQSLASRAFSLRSRISEVRAR